MCFSDLAWCRPVPVDGGFTWRSWEYGISSWQQVMEITEMLLAPIPGTVSLGVASEGKSLWTCEISAVCWAIWRCTVVKGEATTLWLSSPGLWGAGSGLSQRSYASGTLQHCHGRSVTQYGLELQFSFIVIFFFSNHTLKSLLGLFLSICSLFFK